MNRNRVLIKIMFYSFLVINLLGCAGTIKTTVDPKIEQNFFKKAYIVSTKESQYIKFKFGTITPFGYLIPRDDAPEDTTVIGNTAEVIKQELGKYGVEAMIGTREDSPENFDLIIEYNDIWRWDLKSILDRLEIIFISADGSTVIAKSIYNIHRNKEMHNFPTPQKEVPKMIKEIIDEIRKNKSVSSSEN